MTLLSDAQASPEGIASNETETAAECRTITFGDRFYTMMGRGLWGFSAGEEWLPYAPVDVDERVYVRLGDRTYTGGEHEQSVESFIGELRALASKAPKCATAIIKLSTGYGCDDESCRDPEWEVGYWRDPTKKERAEREKTNRKIAERDAERGEANANAERAEYERLKAKFEAA